ncbi:MAG: 4-hydroxyphenyl-beta-ketoacyl-CoA hydrolase [Actinotalea sp.]|nr:4-hydroxyphenyl-beta-ketoacyl-CoA hydrolase [Actinotalea sp.]
MIARNIVAIDMHVHLSDERARSFNTSRKNAMSTYFGKEPRIVPVDDMAAMYRERNMMAVIMNTTETARTGEPSLPNDYVAEVVAAHPDVFLGFGVVDPRLGQQALDEAVRCKEELGLIGIGELNPARQHFLPHDPELAPLWSCAQELDLAVLFHGGYAASGSGTRGGAGVKLRYSRPIYLDDVAAEHPDLRIVCAHPSWPWESEALAVAMHKANVYLDLSGWAPRYFSDELKRYVRSRIPTKVLFGSDWPVIDVDRWVDEFGELGFSDEVTRRVMLDNALTFLGLERAAP